jgi:hypothetical protein
MTTNNAVDVSLSGQTGTGNFVGANTPTLITPILGVATATSLAFSPTTDGIIGTTAANNAASGYVGEFISSVIASGSAVTVANNAVVNITSISLTAGDWDVWGNISTVTVPTTTIALAGWTSTTSVTVPDNSLFSSIYLLTGTLGAGNLCVPQLRYNVSTTTTVYLSITINESSGSGSACGGIYARRIR